MSIIRGYDEVFAPRFFIEANGSLAADIAADITHFEYQDDEIKNTTLTIKVNNEGLKYIDDRRFNEGARFTVRWGYVNDLSPPRTFVISRAKPHFPKGGEVPIIEMVAYDLRSVVNKAINPKNYGKITSAKVAQKIAERYNLYTEIEDSKDDRVQSRVQPGNVTDIQFLMELAKKLNYDFYIEERTLHFHPKRFNLAPTLEFVYFTDGKGTLIDFDPDVDLSKPGGIAANSASAQNGTDQSGHAAGHVETMMAVKDTGTANFSYKGTFVKPSTVNASTSEHDPKVAGILANAAAQRISMAAIKASMTVIGTPRLTARKIIRLVGVGKTYSGNWRVSNTRHVIQPKGEVYTVKVGLTRNGLNLNQNGKSGTGDHTNDKDAASKAPMRNVTDKGSAAFTYGSAPTLGMGLPLGGPNGTPGYTPTTGAPAPHVVTTPPAAPPGQLFSHLKGF